MAVKSGFYNSTNGDRAYSKDDLNSYFDGLVSDGVYRNYLNALAVSAMSPTAMTVAVGTGRARINGYYFVNDAVASVNISASHPSLNRYTTVVARINMSTREASIATIDGTAASTPTLPNLVRNSNMYDIALANVYVAAGVTAITSNMITDLRDDTSLCGWATLTSSIDYNGYIDQAVASYTVTTSEQSINIPTSLDYQTTDKLFVYVDGLFKLEGIDYEFMWNEVDEMYMTVFTSAQSSGSVLYYVRQRLAITDTP